MSSRYSTAVWQRFRSPQQAGVLAGTGVVTARAQTPGSRAVLEMSLLQREGVILDARFRAYGCTVTIATADWFAEQAIGRNLREIYEISVENAVKELDIPAIKRHCALLAQDALQAAARRCQSAALPTLRDNGRR